MAISRISEIIQYLGRRALPRDGAGPTDGQLLDDFLSRHDESAIASIVARHGPMVWGVCRRTLRNYQDAEDAFQATFLVLLRKAASIVPKEKLADWLYGVANQTALKARSTAAKKRLREMQVVAMPEPIGEAERSHDLRDFLDQELSRLPYKYRVVILLCDLQGRTRKEAARQIGVPEGTVAGRLARARAMLARGLTRQGLSLSGAALASVFGEEAAAALMPGALANSTISIAALVAAGNGTAGMVSVNIAALTNKVLKAMLMTKLTTAAGLLLLAALGIGLYLALDSRLPPRPVQAAATEPQDQSSAVMAPIPLVTLQQAPSNLYRAGAGDILAIQIGDVLGKPNEQPPLHHGASVTMGYPIQVRDDGTINLPLIEPLKIAPRFGDKEFVPASGQPMRPGLTIGEITELIRDAYTKAPATKVPILKHGTERISVALLDLRQYRVLVLREDGAKADASTAATRRAAAGHALNLPRGENDVLNALTLTGGTPNSDATIVVYKHNREKVGAGANVAHIVRIPLCYKTGEPLGFNPNDVILDNGDIVYVEMRSSEAGDRKAAPSPQPATPLPKN
jgi:RNA polymerase sigma factor (sigma-70 family)